MSNQDPPYFLVLDANVWIAERLLQSSLGRAVLYALAADRASIILPEIVEMEVELVLKQQTDKATEDLRKNADFLRQISGHQKVFHAVPTRQAIEDGIARRWKELSGVIIRAPLSIEQARSSLLRVLNHLPPSGENNEQFRDCCIWATALEFSESRVVHLVTNDGSFYSGRDRQNIAPSLRSDVEALGRTVRLHSSVGNFLEMVSHERIEALEKEVIYDEILKSVTTLAREIAAERANSRHSQGFDLGDAQRLTIKGYTTPKPSLVAVAFEVSFDLKLLDQEGSGEREVDSTLTLDGSCSYDPLGHETSDVVVKSWSHNLKSHQGFHWSQMSPNPTFQEQMAQTRYV